MTELQTVPGVEQRVSPHDALEVFAREVATLRVARSMARQAVNNLPGKDPERWDRSDKDKTRYEQFAENKQGVLTTLDEALRDKVGELMTGLNQALAGDTTKLDVRRALKLLGVPKPVRNELAGRYDEAVLDIPEGDLVPQIVLGEGGVPELLVTFARECTDGTPRLVIVNRVSYVSPEKATVSTELEPVA